MLKYEIFENGNGLFSAVPSEINVNTNCYFDFPEKSIKEVVGKILQDNKHIEIIIRK